MHKMSNESILDILVTSSINSFHSQRRFPTNTTIRELRQKLELITGACASTMELHLLDDKNELIEKILDDNTVLSSCKLANAKVLHVVDTFRKAGEFEDVSQVKKFELSEEEYSKRGESLRAFKNKLKLQEKDTKAVDEKKMKEEEEMAASIHIGNRCEVHVAGKSNRRGTVMYVGKVEFKPGYWIGVKYDEPLGKNDGSVKGKKYFECLPNYGGFVKPHDVIVGDFPEEAYELDEL